ncbi:PQQ-binding-like beta-propeller repeat protein [uncultured Draconibacterium sp.]|uniref:outer membrane protein assembly factor BamB family protein n=1 Tax=uncultured Draconibacterium sp. TaxID=1573823 RepID=UPI0032171B6B
MNTTDKLKLSQNIAVIAGIFCLAVAMLLLLNFWQVSKTDPIESKALEALVQRLKQEPNNDELKVEIRNFDLLARKAYFNSQWQVKTGAYLLLFGAIILAFALRVYYSVKSKIEEPDAKLENEIASRILAQKGIIIVGATVLILAVLASFATVNHLNYYNTETQSAEAVSSPETEGIEVIEVGEISKTEVAETSTVKNTETEKSDSDENVAEETEITEEKNTHAQKEPAAKTAVATGITLADLQKNHNSLRGPLGQGVIAHKNIPTTWNGSAGTNVLWKSPIPKHGYNSPVIWGDKIFIAGADNTTREVYCYNRNDGKLLWTGVADNVPGSPASPPRVTEDTGLAAPTLTVDNKGVYAIFATGDVIAFDLNGKRLWARNLGVPDNHYGHSSSLITWANKVLVQYDTNRGGKILALNTSNGETVWETVRDSKISWASPILAEIDGKYQVVLTADPIVAGYDVETGKELWQVECMMGEVGPSAAFSDGVVFAANEYARLVAIDPKNASIIWENDEYMPEAASPLAHNGLLIIATSYGVLVCYDAKTGEQFWEDDLGSTLYASPVVADGKLFMMDNDGVMRIYEFSKELKKISENELGETAGTTPAFSNGRIYIRGENNLYCIGK